MRFSLSRRSLVGSSAVGLAGLLAGGADEPRELRGTVKDQQVTLPRLHAGTEAEGSVPAADPMARRMGVAVVGLGHLALEEILPAFGQARHVRVTALVSGDPAKAKVIAGQYDVPETGIYGYDTFDKLRDNPDVDVVYIVLPNAMHAEYTVRAAQAGKHVLCEKPMATTVEDAERMVRACKDADRKLMIAYRMQYEPYTRQLIGLARGTDNGRVRLIEAVNAQNDAPNGQWRQIKAMAGGGSLPDVGLYCLNAARYVTGEEPVEISAMLNQPKDDPRFREIEDTVAFTLRFPSGVLATCSSGYSAHESRQLRVMAEGAYYEMSPAFSYRDLSLRIGRRSGEGNAEEQRHLPERSQFALEMDHFAQAIRANQPPRTPGEEGLQDQRLMAAIYQAAEGGSTVKLPEVRGRDTTRGTDPPAFEARQG